MEDFEADTDSTDACKLELDLEEFLAGHRVKDSLLVLHALAQVMAARAKQRGMSGEALIEHIVCCYWSEEQLEAWAQDPEPTQ